MNSPTPERLGTVVAATPRAGVAAGVDSTSLWRDPWLRWVAALSAAAALASTASDSPAVESWLGTWVDPTLLALQAAALVRAARGARSAEEKRFWHLLGLGATLWLLVHLLQVIWPFAVDSTGYLVTDLLLLGFCLAVLLAAETPRSTATEVGLAQQVLQTGGLVFFVVSMTTYFVVIPYSLDRSGYETLSPSLLCFVLFDLIIVFRFVALRSTSGSRRWRSVYALLAFAFCCDAIYDLKDFVFLRWNVGSQFGGPISVFWYLSFIAFVGAASRSRSPSDAAAEDEARSSSSLALYLVIVPIAHLIAERTNPLAAPVEDAREVLAIVHVVVLGTLAMAQYALAERRNRGLRLKLRFAAEELQRSGRMEALGRMAGVVAHDFNNLLSVILGYTDLLLTGSLSAQDEHAVSEIRGAGERAAALTKQLLAFSRQQPVVGNALDLDASLAQILGMVRRLVGESTSVAFAPGAPGAWCRCDASQLSQIVLNLSANARDAMPKGGRLTIRTRRLPASASDPKLASSDTPYLELEVEDDGTGIEPHVLDHLFEPFYTTKSTGTGLGLAAVYGIVRQHDGSIRVESEPGRGTRVHVLLPETAPREFAAVERAALPRPTASESRTILIAEDDSALRALLHRALEGQGWETIDCPDGAAALARASSLDGIDALVTDLVMPGLSGRELAERLRQRWPKVPVIFMSGYAGEVLRDYGFDPGSTMLLVKPFEISALVARLKTLFVGQRTDSA